MLLPLSPPPLPPPPPHPTSGMLTSSRPPAQGLFDLLYGSDAFLRAYHKALNNDPGWCTGIEGCAACPTLPWLSALLPAHSGVHAAAMACRLDSSMQCWRIRRHMGQVVPNPCAQAPAHTDRRCICGGVERRPAHCALQHPGGRACVHQAAHRRGESPRLPPQPAG